MANTNKMTKVEMYNAILAFIDGYPLPNVNTDQMSDFIRHEISLLQTKAARASSKPTKTQTENMGITQEIISALTTLNKYVTITEMQEATPSLAGYSNQKLSALMRKLVENGTVVKTVEKKKSYFTIAVVDTEDEADSYAKEFSGTELNDMLN